MAGMKQSGYIPRPAPKPRPRSQEAGDIMVDVHRTLDQRGFPRNRKDPGRVKAAEQELRRLIRLEHQKRQDVI
jgi:hypothetical protein